MLAQLFLMPAPVSVSIDIEDFNNDNATIGTVDPGAGKIRVSWDNEASPVDVITALERVIQVMEEKAFSAHPGQP